MTPEERAERAVDAMAQHWSDYNYDEIVAQFRDAIKAGIKEEREACAQLIDREAKGFQVWIDHSPTLIRAEDLKRVKHSIENVAKQIRARSS